MSLANKENINIESIKNVVLTIGFVALLIFPTVQKYFSIVPELESTENRQLASKPIISFNNRDQVPGLID